FSVGIVSLASGAPARADAVNDHDVAVANAGSARMQQILGLYNASPVGSCPHEAQRYQQLLNQFNAIWAQESQQYIKESSRTSQYGYCQQRLAAMRDRYFQRRQTCIIEQPGIVILPPINVGCDDTCKANQANKKFDGIQSYYINRNPLPCAQEKGAYAS